MKATFVVLQILGDLILGSGSKRARGGVLESYWVLESEGWGQSSVQSSLESVISSSVSKNFLSLSPLLSQPDKVAGGCTDVQVVHCR